MCLISERIALLAASMPEATALHAGEARLSFAELDRRASRLASHLATLGVKDGVAVAICLERSFDQIIAALGVMRAGAAYVPLDPAWPVERMRTILADSEAAVFIAPRELSRAVADGAIELCPLADGAVIAAADALVAPILDPQSLAYIIYTSGSTGTPKGVEITHANLAHLVARYAEAFAITPEDRAGHLAGLGFDGSVFDVWPHLGAGASVVLADDLVRTSPALLQEWMAAQRITVSFVPTALAEPMIRMDWPSDSVLRFLLVAGEALHAVPRPGLPFAVYNAYGPTECTVMATYGLVSPELEGVPTIGLAMPGAQVHVLNEQGSRAWVGETGELYIGGDGVGRGYRNLPELTARCFVPDPFSSKLGARLYRTGDHAAQMANGEIAFRGRVDGQEKIRGQRLELDEIVCVLNRHPGVAFSAVAAQGQGAEKRLIAYVLPAEEALLGTSDLQSYLTESLPAFMVPAVYVRLASIPLNVNGKLDRAALPEPCAENVLPEAPGRGASTPIEEALLGIVRTLVRSEHVGVDDDFFLVGGHSLMGTQLIMRVRESFGVPLTLRDLFEGATVEQLALRVEALLLAELDAMSDEEALKQVVN